jgi:hypothetical protein
VSHVRVIFKGDRSRLLALAVVAVALAACGGDEGERLSEADWIAQADSICAEAQDELDALPEPANAAELAEQAEAAVEIAERQLARLRDLRPPEAAEADFGSMLDLTERQIEITGEIAEAAAARDQAAVQELVAEGESVDDRADELAAGYGFDSCGGS